MADAKLVYRWMDGQGEAFGAPGAEPRWTSSAKDVVGTAYATSSKLWWTVSHGIVNELYYPTIDRPQVRDLELMITDGETFIHEEKRDLEHTFEYIHVGAPGVLITNRDRGGRYSLTKQIISDPHAPVLLMRVKVEGDAGLLKKLKIYALLAPHIEVCGRGNSARVLDVAGRRVLLAWKNGTSLAMAADCGFTRASCGFVGQSDGWQDLQHDFRMDWEFGSAHNGNIALMGEIDVAAHPEFMVAVGLGEGHHAALTSTVGSLHTSFEVHCLRFLEQWHRVQIPRGLEPKSGDRGRLLKASHKVLLAHEDKTFAGAFIASASIPWGQTKGDNDLGGYHLVWTRDMVQSATALLACGHKETAMRALIYLACTQKPDGGFAQNFWVDGTPYWSGVQLDETAFPIILAWRMWKLDALGQSEVLPFVERAAGFLVRHAPVTPQDRWEEAGGYSPSTLAVVITALICAADMVRSSGSLELAQFLEEQGDWIESHLEDWTVTNAGVLLPEVPRHYMRIRPPEVGEMYMHESAGTEKVRLANRAPGERFEFEAREIVDGGFLELVRYGVRAADDPLMVDTVKVMDAVLKRDLPQGPGYRRYNHDGYGQRHDGSAYDGSGQGRAWPLLTGERAHYELALGGKVKPLIETMEGLCSAGGMLPEQTWDADDIPEEGMVRGQPTGAAMPLVWAHAEYVKLLRSAADGRVFDRVSVVAERYGVERQDGKGVARAGARPVIEVWRKDRQVRRMDPRRRLRIESEQYFHLIWTADDWNTTERTESRSVGSAGFFADAAATRGDPGYGERILFTLFWPEENRWEGDNYEVTVEHDPVSGV
jgi:glucoamylase